VYDSYNKYLQTIQQNVLDMYERELYVVDHVSRGRVLLYTKFAVILTTLIHVVALWLMEFCVWGL